MADPNDGTNQPSGGGNQGGDKPSGSTPSSEPK